MGFRMVHYPECTTLISIKGSMEPNLNKAPEVGGKKRGEKLTQQQNKKMLMAKTRRNPCQTTPGVS